MFAIMRAGGCLALVVLVLVSATCLQNARAAVLLRTGTPHAEKRWVAVFRNESSAEARADHIVRHRAIADSVRAHISAPSFPRLPHPFLCHASQGLFFSLLLCPSASPSLSTRHVT